MNRPVQPSSRLGWWALGLAFAAGLWTRLFPIISVRWASGLSDRTFGDLAGIVIEIALALAAVMAGALAMKRGERSWLTLIGMVLALVIATPWFTYALGQALGPR